MTDNDQNIQNDAPNQGAQGQFHGDVNTGTQQDVSGERAVGIGSGPRDSDRLTVHAGGVSAGVASGCASGALGSAAAYPADRRSREPLRDWTERCGCAGAWLLLPTPYRRRWDDGQTPGLVHPAACWWIKLPHVGGSGCRMSLAHFGRLLTAHPEDRHRPLAYHTPAPTATPPPASAAPPDLGRCAACAATARSMHS